VRAPLHSQTLRRRGPLSGACNPPFGRQLSPCGGFFDKQDCARENVGREQTMRSPVNRGCVLVCGAFALASSPAFAQTDSAAFKAACESLAKQTPAGAGRLTEAVFVPAGPVALPPPAPPGASATSPDSLLIRGKINERTGIDGKPYAVGYEVRLPADGIWNGKFIFQGGGGVDGVVRPALATIGSGAPSPNGLSVGYAAASTDAGHQE